ncbi:MAG: adenylosuccinate synthase [Chloroflexi bacterium]|nr:adenylosuccinate synthase [Chloroflexota bacterium]
MPASVIVGLQWGDEGKGKTTDFLAEQVAMVVRYQGGDNAGHTIVIGEDTFKLHLVPSGVLYGHITPVIGPGVVVNPATLLREFDELTARGIDVSHVRVSHAASLILPYHVALDKAREAALGGAKVGTTGRGIGPAYEDRAARTGLRVEDLIDPASAATRLARALPEKRALLKALNAEDAAAVDADAIAKQIAAWGERLRPDTTDLVQRALAAGEHLLFEGAQGTLLDLSHGSYPYVTSSHPIAGGAATGGGIAPMQIDEVMGVMKAYATRVGSGPFVTELTDAIGERITTTGHEVGTTTGRRRRVGWNDALPLRYAVQLNGVSSIMLNKLDVLSGIPEILLCVAYEIDGKRVERWPSSTAEMERATPIYERFPGWSEPIHQVRALADLPENARRYVTALEEIAGAPIVLLSVGPERTQTIERAWRPMRRATKRA